jgi:hypothetical protein
MTVMNRVEGTAVNPDPHMVTQRTPVTPQKI